MTDIYQNIEAEIPRLQRYARVLVRDRTAADDLVQECLVRALGKLHLWQEGSNLRAWLFTILHNQHVNIVRRAIRTGPTVELGESAALRLSRPADQDKHLELRDLDRALAQLPEAQRAVILLAGLEGMPYDEVGAVLGIPTGTVRSRLSRGRDTLRRLMGVEPDQRDEPKPSAIVALRLAARTAPAPAERPRPIHLHPPTAPSLHRLSAEPTDRAHPRSIRRVAPPATAG